METKSGIKKVQQVGNLLLIDDEYWSPDYTRDFASTHIIGFKKVPKKEYDEMVKRIASKVKSTIDIERLVTQSLAVQPIEILKKVDKKLKNKRTKIKQRNGCTELEIGGERIQIGL